MLTPVARSLSEMRELWSSRYSQAERMNLPLRNLHLGQPLRCLPEWEYSAPQSAVSLEWECEVSSSPIAFPGVSLVSLPSSLSCFMTFCLFRSLLRFSSPLRARKPDTLPPLHSFC